jgi:hypothetical protein
VATLTYVYADRTVVLGPLAVKKEPFAYDLCAEHAEHLTPPRGWEVIRLAPEWEAAQPSDEDLAALADSIRERARRAVHDVPPAPLPSARRGHLRVVPGGAA